MTWAHTNQRLLTSLTRDDEPEGYDTRLAPHEPLSIRTGVFLGVTPHGTCMYPVTSCVGHVRGEGRFVRCRA
jgi:hypothetical protein